MDSRDRLPNPVRGGLFVERMVPSALPFVFRPAHSVGMRANISETFNGMGGAKNKREMLGVAGSTKRSPLTGFMATEDALARRTSRSVWSAPYSGAFECDREEQTSMGVLLRFRGEIEKRRNTAHSKRFAT